MANVENACERSRGFGRGSHRAPAGPHSNAVPTECAWLPPQPDAFSQAGVIPYVQPG